MSQFCEKCEVHAKKLVLDQRAETKKQNEALKSANSEITSLSNALTHSNEKYGQERILVDKLRSEIEELKKSLQSASSTTQSVVKTTAEALDFAQVQIKELEAENMGLKQCGKTVQGTALITGVTAAVSGGVCAHVYKDQQAAAGTLIGVAISSLLIGGLSGILNRLRRGKSKKGIKGSAKENKDSNPKK